MEFSYKTPVGQILDSRPQPAGAVRFYEQSVEPVFPDKRQAINYAENGGCFRSGEIRILDSSGNVERAIA